MKTESSKRLGVSDLLIGDTPKPNDYYYVAVTLSHPETNSFMSMLSHQQKNVYKNIIKRMMKSVDIATTVHGFTAYEFTKKGKVHSHSLLRFSREYIISAVGLISDLSKSACNSMVKKFNSKNLLNNEYGVTYKDSGLCIDLICSKEDGCQGYTFDESYKNWVEYMMKDQPTQ